jgi:hypothetical protein
MVWASVLGFPGILRRAGLTLMSASSLANQVLQASVKELPVLVAHAHQRIRRTAESNRCRIATGPILTSLRKDRLKLFRNRLKVSVRVKSRKPAPKPAIQRLMAAACTCALPSGMVLRMHKCR